MGNNYSAPSSSTLSSLDENYIDTPTHTNVNFNYLINYNKQTYFSNSIEDIICLVDNIRNDFIKQALNCTTCCYHIYEKVYGKCQDKIVDKKLFKEILNNVDDCDTVYELEITKAYRNILISYETTVNTLKITRVYNLSSIMEDDDSDEDNTVELTPAENETENVKEVSQDDNDNENKKNI